jgi:hypothetical protein
MKSRTALATPSGLFQGDARLFGLCGFDLGHLGFDFGEFFAQGLDLGLRAGLGGVFGAGDLAVGIPHRIGRERAQEGG